MLCTLSVCEACDRTLTNARGAFESTQFSHVDAVDSASRAAMAAAAEQSAAELKRIDRSLCVIEDLVRCPFALLLLPATCKR